MLTIKEILDDFTASINTNAISISSRGPNGKSPLHFMAVIGDEKAIRLLVTNGAEISAEDEKGNTPLHEAVLNRQANVVRALIELGANVRLRSLAGETPKDIAIKDGYDPVITIIGGY